MGHAALLSGAMWLPREAPRERDPEFRATLALVPIESESAPGRPDALGPRAPVDSDPGARATTRGREGSARLSSPPAAATLAAATLAAATTAAPPTRPPSTARASAVASARPRVIETPAVATPVSTTPGRPRESTAAGVHPPSFAGDSAAVAGTERGATPHPGAAPGLPLTPASIGASRGDRGRTGSRRHVLSGRDSHSAEARAARRSGLDAYASLVRRAVLEQRAYPYLALRRRIQGTVCVRLTIDARGRVTRASPSCGAAREMLTDAALDAVRRAAPFPPLPAPLGRRVTLDLPIVFRIDER